MTQQFFSLSAGRQITSQVAIIPGLLSQTILERDCLMNSAPSLDGL
jgi:hypothetical protein